MVFIMKRLIWLLPIILPIFLISCSTPLVQSAVDAVKVVPDASDYTYDGDIDPIVFFSWDVVEVDVYEDEYIYFDLKNPDHDADVKAARTINIPSLHDSESVILIAYWYFKDDVKYMFVLEEDRSHYSQVLPDWGI